MHYIDQIVLKRRFRNKHREISGLFWDVKNTLRKLSKEPFDISSITIIRGFAKKKEKKKS